MCELCILRIYTFGIMKLNFLFVLLVLFSSCNDEITSKLAPKPVALGRLNDVVVIADEDVWDGEVGEAFRFLYESAYPIMPSPEPLFDLRHFTPLQLEAEPLRRELRTYVLLADLSDKESSSTKILRRDFGEEKFNKAIQDTSFITTAGKDKWAREQLFAYVFGAGKTELIHSIQKSFPAIAQRIKKHDEKQLSSNVFNLHHEDMGLKKQLQSYFNVDMKIPSDYKSKLQLDENFVILKRDESEFSQTIVLRKFPYQSEDQFSMDNIIKWRNEYGKAFISGSSDASYMRTNHNDLPVYEYDADIENVYGKEFRGIWELTDDFIGGPFICFTLLNQSTNEIIFIDAFVYAPSPSKNKRDLIQQLEYIVRNIKMINPEVSE